MKERIRAYIAHTLPETVRQCDTNEGTLLALPFPYTVPCAGEMFQELYYWDTYFTNVGLLCLGEIELARHNIDNMLWLVDTYGFMPNGNRTYYLNRSQPPFLSEMVRDLYEVHPDRAWLRRAYTTLCREYTFWQTKRMLPTGLNGYTGHTLPDADRDFLYEHFVARTGQRLADDPDDAIKRQAQAAVISFFESGWDCTSRFLSEGHRMMAVDLNSLLFGMEQNMAYIAAVLENGEEKRWNERAAERRHRMYTLLWDPSRNIFADRHADSLAFSPYASAASLYPLFVGCADEAQATAALSLLETLMLPGGVAAGEPHPPWNCQWDYPNVWAPLQWIAWKAMKRYGFDAQAQEIAVRFTATVEDVFEKTGNFWEKYNGLTGEVAADEYAAPPMMGWTAGVYMALDRAINAGDTSQ